MCEFELYSQDLVYAMFQLLLPSDMNTTHWIQVMAIATAAAGVAAELAIDTY